MRTPVAKKCSLTTQQDALLISFFVRKKHKLVKTTGSAIYERTNKPGKKAGKQPGFTKLQIVVVYIIYLEKKVGRGNTTLCNSISQSIGKMLRSSPI
jgi:hypothetical protein